MSTNFPKARDIEAIALSTIHTMFDAGGPESRATDVGLPRPESRVDRVLRSLAVIRRLRPALGLQR
jgi:hypothetical protein